MMWVLLCPVDKLETEMQMSWVNLNQYLFI